MKKHLLLLSIFFAAIIFSTNVIAQDKVLLVSAKLEAATDYTETTFVNPLARLKFHKEFKGIINDDWSESNNGYKVWFSRNEIKCLVFLDKKGNYISQISEYGEKNLPADIRKLVKSTYYDYTIKHIKEVNCKGLTAYFITLEDETSWKEIRIMDGEIEIWKAYNKEK